MSIPFIDHCTLKTFTSPLFLAVPIGYALEGLRRCWLSGTSLALFIDIGSCGPESCIRDCANLRRYLDVDRDVIQAVPEILRPLIAPWIDHHNAQECFYEIALELCMTRNFPDVVCDNCYDIWRLQP